VHAKAAAAPIFVAMNSFWFGKTTAAVAVIVRSVARSPRSTMPLHARNANDPLSTGREKDSIGTGNENLALGGVQGKRAATSDVM